jgi:hypothetical protein
LKFFGKNFQNQEFLKGKTPKPKKNGARKNKLYQPNIWSQKKKLINIKK